MLPLIEWQKAEIEPRVRTLIVSNLETYWVW